MLAIFCTSSEYGNDRMQLFYEHIANYFQPVDDQIDMRMIVNLEVAQKMKYLQQPLYLLF